MDDVPRFGADELLLQAGWARALARRLVVDEARADDLLQQAWLAARANPASERRSPRAWLGGVLRNVASKQRREDERRAAREKIAALAESQPSSSSAVAELEAQRLVVDALLKLDEPCRETLVRRWYRDEKPAAIARAMGVPVKTVDTRLARGLERLRAELTALRGGDRRAWGLALVPLAVHAKAAATAVVLGSLAAGVATMSTFSKLVAAAIVVAAAWWGLGRALDPSSARVPTSANVEDPRAAAAEVAGGTAHERDADVSAVRSEIDPASRPSSRRVRPGPTLHVHVVDVDGNDVRSAMLFLLRGEKVVGEGIVPERAERSIAVPTEDANLLVQSRECPPVVVPVAAGSTSLEVRMPRDHVFSGQLSCGGRSPGPLRLEFTTDPPASGEARVPAVVDVRGELRFGRIEQLHLATTTDFEGQFRFTGLDADASGVLTIPFGWSFEPITRDFSGQLKMVSTRHFAAPAEKVRVELFSPPVVVGTLVHEDGSPVSGFTIEAHGDSPSGGFSQSDSDRSRTAGRFRVALPIADARALELEFVDWVVAPTRRAHLHLEGPFEGTRDVGEVRIAHAGTVELHVVDATGAPIDAAIVELHGDGGERRVERTSGQDVTLSATYPRARVGAFGYLARDIELPKEGSSAPIEVVLTKTTELAVTVEDAPSAAGAASDLELTFRGPLFGSDPNGTLDWIGVCIRHANGGMPMSFTTDPSGESHATFSDALRGVRLFGLASEVPFQVRLRGVAGLVLFDQEVTLAEAESRELVVRVDASVRRFAGRVVSPDGTPIRHAEVRLQSVVAEPERGGISTSTDPDGHFAFTEFLEEVVALQIVAPGHVTLRRARFELPRSDDVETFNLAECWPLRVEIVDGAGHPVDGAEVTAMVAETADGAATTPFHSGPAGDGAFTFVDLPSASIRVRVDVAGARYEQAAAPPMSVVRFVVPTNGRVVVRYDLPIPEAAKRGRVMGAIELAPRDGHGARVTVDANLFDPPRRAGAVEFGAVLPGSYEVVLIWRDEEGRDLEREATAEFIDVGAGETAETTVTR